MIKRIEVEHVFPPIYKKRILHMSLTEPEVKIVDYVFKFIQISSKGYSNKFF